MSFLAPIWLLGLLPWAAVVVWLLTGTSRREPVPFLALWRGPVQPRPVARRLRIPPVAIVAALAAVLTAIIAAARPAVRVTQPSPPHLTFIVDHGLTMSAGAVGGVTRLERLIDSAADAVAAAVGSGPAEMVFVPGGVEHLDDRSRWAERARRAAATAVDTRDALHATVARAIAGGRGPVIVLSDRVIDLEDADLVQIAPAQRLENVGIAQLAARSEPASQVMVVVRNDSSTETAAVLRVMSGNHEARQEIDLPGPGEQMSVFLDVAELGPYVTAVLDVEDDLEADNQAWLVRGRSWPRVEVAGQLPAELLRMIDVYGRARPAGQGAERVLVAGRVEELPERAPGVAIADFRLPIADLGAGEGHLVVEDHPITRNVATVFQEEEFRSQISNVEIGNRQSAIRNGLPESEIGTWTILISLADHPLLAVREEPVRQVWVGFTSPDWARRAEFVMFWTDVFDWVGGGEDAFRAETVRQLGEGWRRQAEGAGADRRGVGLWPGLYRGPDGELIAMNASAVEVRDFATPDWREQLAALSRTRASARELSAWLLLAAMCLMLISALTWAVSHQTRR